MCLKTATSIFAVGLCQAACMLAALAAISDCVYDTAGWLAGWHLLICSGLGTNAQKHSVDGTRSQLFPLGDASWMLLTVQHGRMHQSQSHTEHIVLTVTIKWVYFWNLKSCRQSEPELAL